MAATAPPFPLYDRLCRKQKEACRIYDLKDYSIKLARLLRIGDENNGTQLTGLIFAIIYHHSLLQHKAGFSDIPYKGRTPPGSDGRGIIFEMKNLPPPLLQIIYILMEEIYSGECPEMDIS